MKARLPKMPGGMGNLQQLAQQAKQIQDKMDKATAELEQKEYSADSEGGAVSVTVTGKMEVKSIELNPEIVDPEDTEMLSDLITVAVNKALKAAVTDKSETMDKISNTMNIPGMG